jgi:hypothetical protein
MYIWFTLGQELLGMYGIFKYIFTKKVHFLRILNCYYIAWFCWSGDNHLVLIYDTLWCLIRYIKDEKKELK